MVTRSTDDRNPSVSSLAVGAIISIVFSRRKWSRCKRVSDSIDSKSLKEKKKVGELALQLGNCMPKSPFSSRRLG